ncbi:MAG: hypothetical protein CVU97_04195 [Firmicutes bacterium HGW-Firmicutes-21]|nr:MAG: hypothetical protein CVU97_04195 [Firmicutes bacterium HGW-Firmicutes-21]
MRAFNRFHGLIAKLLVVAMLLVLVLPLSAPLQLVSQGSTATLITSNTVWKYRQDNIDPAIGTQGMIIAGLRNGWTMPASPHMLVHNTQIYDGGYNDSAWLSAQGPFGFKIGSSTHLDCRTYLTQNVTGSSARIPTYFFRTTFTVSDLSSYSQLFYKLRFDDAVIIYINGVEVGRHNTPTSGYSQNLQYGAISAAGTYIEDAKTMTDISMLREGVNTIAVELHQSASDSSDIYFNFMELSLGRIEELKAITVTPGSNESMLNFAWLSLSSSTGKVEISDGSSTKTFLMNETAEIGPTGLYTNRVTVTDLLPDTIYTYKVGNGTVWSDSYTITTGSTESFGFLFAGDPQIGSSNLTNDVVRWNTTITRSLTFLGRVDFLISAGDQVEVASNEIQYDGYFSPDLLKNIPVATSVGNHDVAVNYKHHFNLPNHDATKGNTIAGGNYYFTYNNVLFMMLNMNNTSAAGHKLFMENAIAANPDAKWRIVVFHQTIYSVALHSIADQTIKNRSSLVPVFDALDIDIVLMGHDHCYTRSYQMKGNQIQNEQTINNKGQLVDPTGIIYLTANSSSGSKYYAIRNQEFVYSALSLQLNVPTISKIDMTADTFTFNTYRIDTMQLIDTYSILKNDVINRAPLKTALDIANLKDLTIYTKVSADAYETAILAAQAIYDDENATQAEINAAVNALQAAAGNLVLKPSKKLLTELIIKAEDLIEERYTAESFEAITAPLIHAQTVAEAGDATKEQIDVAYNDLLTAISALQLIDSPEMQALENAITLAESVDINNYYDSYKQAFIDSLTAAKEALISGNLTFVEISGLTQKLTADFNALIPLPDKESLQTLVNQCLAVNKALYTDNSVSTFNDALTAAEFALTAENSQAQVNEAYNALYQAYTSLVLKDITIPVPGDAGMSWYIIFMVIFTGTFILISVKRKRALL